MVYVPKEQFKGLQSSQTISSEVMLKGHVSWWFWKVSTAPNAKMALGAVSPDNPTNTKGGNNMDNNICSQRFYYPSTKDTYLPSPFL